MLFKKLGRRYDELIVVEDVSLSGGGARPIFNYYNQQVAANKKKMAMVRLVYRNGLLKLLYLSLFSDKVIINSLTCFKHWAVILVCYLKKNTIIYVHDCAPHTEPFAKKYPAKYRHFLKLLQKRRVGFVSEWQSKYFLEKVTIPRYRIIYNNVLFPFQKNGSPVTIAMIAYQNENKNVSFFSKVADEAFSQQLPWSFVWAGGQGGDTSSLYHSPHVKWLGDQDQVMEVINQADVFLFTSKADSFPLVFAEVLYKGKRIVSYDQNGFASHVSGVNGCRLYSSFDEKNVLQQVKEVLKETPDAAKQKEIATALCSIENFEKRLDELSDL